VRGGAGDEHLTVGRNGDGPRLAAQGHVRNRCQIGMVATRRNRTHRGNTARDVSPLRRIQDLTGCQQSAKQPEADQPMQMPQRFLPNDY
jgi:hypothetical protein